MPPNKRAERAFNLEQRLQSMQSQLSMTYIKSPISGTVDEVKLKLGELHLGFAVFVFVNF